MNVKLCLTPEAHTLPTLRILGMTRGAIRRCTDVSFAQFRIQNHRFLKNEVYEVSCERRDAQAVFGS